MDDIVFFEGGVARILRETPGLVVCCTDALDGAILPHAAMTRLLGVMLRDNTRIERNGILIPTRRAGVQMQAERLIREGQNVARRLFGSVSALLSWLDESLAEDERARLRDFLSVPRERLSEKLA
jgi:hypothetical protein